MFHDWQDPTDPSESKLRPKDRRFLLICLLVAAVTLAVGFYLFPRVNPEASIRFKVDRGEAREAALEFARSLDLELSDYRHAGRFTYNDRAKVFLERTLGLEGANRLMSGPVRMWRWGNRWFQPGEKEEVRIEVATTGEIASFRHQLEEAASGAGLPASQARGIAEAFLRNRLGVDAAGLEFLDVRTEKLPNRIDHTFTWKRADIDWNGGDYRLEVRIQGNRPGAYQEYVHIPEEWSRDYDRLRSRNETAGFLASAFLLLTFLAILIVLLIKIRARDVRWRTAFWFGAVGTVLMLLVGINSFPVSFYGYDTNESFSGFLIQRIFLELAQALAAGLFFFVLTAASEPLYREMYPNKFSLGRFFTLRGLRTRRFLLSAVLGLTLTCFFFFYQEVFYTIAQHFGAWAPAQVPYDSLFNTALPWVFILFIGFFPAVSEEFSSRMFSIPFLQKYTRSTALAVILPAMIWGFAHSTYPNQPFFIRGLEVGFAGILIGLIMLRTNVLSVLVWHYTVDALYSSYLLFRSGNLYYIVSAALAAGLILLPLVYAAISYRRRGRFEDPQGLRNRDDVRRPAEAELPDTIAGRAGPAIPEPGLRDPGESAPRVPAGRTPSSSGASEDAAAQAAEAGDGPTGTVRPWGVRRRAVIGLVALVGMILVMVPAPNIESGRWMQVGREEAQELAGEFLQGLGESPDSFRVSVLGTVANDPMRAKFLMEHGGLDRLQRQYESVAPPMGWSIRYYRPLETREVLFRLNMEDGRMLSMVRHIAEDDSLPALSQARARSLAENFVQERGVDLASMSLTEAAEQTRPRRTDHSFTWEAGAEDPRSAGEAHHRVAASVQGNQVGGFSQFLHLPEEWVRGKESRGVMEAIRLVVALLVLGGVLGLLLWSLILSHRSGRIRWKPILIASIPFGLLALVGGVNTWPQVMDRYDTSIPWGMFLVTALVGMGVGAVAGYLLAAISLAVATSFWPESWSLKEGRVRALLMGDAVLGAGAAVLAVLALRNLSGYFPALWPAASLPPGVDSPEGVNTTLPWFGVVYNTVRSTLLFGAVAAGLLALLGLRRNHRAWTWAALVLASIALTPGTAKGPAEFLLAWLWIAVEFALVLILVRWVLGRNLLAYPLAVYLLIALGGVAPWLQAEGEYFKNQGMIAGLVLAAPLVWLILSSLRARER